MTVKTVNKLIDIALEKDKLFDPENFMARCSELAKEGLSESEIAMAFGLESVLAFRYLRYIAMNLIKKRKET